MTVQVRRGLGGCCEEKLMVGGDGTGHSEVDLTTARRAAGTTTSTLTIVCRLVVRRLWTSSLMTRTMTIHLECGVAVSATAREATLPPSADPRREFKSTQPILAPCLTSPLVQVARVVFGGTSQRTAQVRGELGTLRRAPCHTHLPPPTVPLTMARLRQPAQGATLVREMQQTGLRCRRSRLHLQRCALRVLWLTSAKPSRVNPGSSSFDGDARSAHRRRVAICCPHGAFRP